MAMRKVITDPVKMLRAFNQTLEGTEYEGMLPEPRDGNLVEYQSTLWNYPKIMNAFFNNIVNLAFVVVNKMYFSNPLSFAKQGEMPYRYTIEDIWVDICKAHSFYGDNVQENEVTGVLRQEKPNLKVAFHPMNRKEFFKQSVGIDSLKGAFYSENGLNEFVNRIIDGLYTSNDVTEFIYQMALFSDFLDNGMIKLEQVPSPTDKDSSNKFLSVAKTISNQFLFPSRLYNPTGVMNSSARLKQIVWLTAKADAIISVEALAYAFNMDKAELMGKIVMIPEIPNHPEVIAVISDENFMKIYDNLFRAETMWNQETLTWTYWLHVWQTMFLSPFHNAVALTTGDIYTVTSTTVTGPATYTPGSIAQYSSMVEGTGNPPSKGIWRVEGNTSPATQIDDRGYLSVGLAEKGTLKITFTPFADTTKVGKLEVTPAIGG